jgi:hypothetical protein
MPTTEAQRPYFSRVRVYVSRYVLYDFIPPSRNTTDVRPMDVEICFRFGGFTLRQSAFEDSSSITSRELQPCLSRKMVRRKKNISRWLDRTRQRSILAGQLPQNMSAGHLEVTRHHSPGLSDRAAALVVNHTFSVNPDHAHPGRFDAKILGRMHPESLAASLTKNARQYFESPKDASQYVNIASRIFETWSLQNPHRRGDFTRSFTDTLRKTYCDKFYREVHDSVTKKDTQMGLTLLAAVVPPRDLETAIVEGFRSEPDLTTRDSLKVVSAALGISLSDPKRTDAVTIDWFRLTPLFEALDDLYPDEPDQFFQERHAQLKSVIKVAMTPRDQGEKLRDSDVWYALNEPSDMPIAIKARHMRRPHGIEQSGDLQPFDLFLRRSALIPFDRTRINVWRNIGLYIGEHEDMPLEELTPFIQRLLSQAHPTPDPLCVSGLARGFEKGDLATLLDVPTIVVPLARRFLTTMDALLIVPDERYNTVEEVRHLYRAINNLEQKHQNIFRDDTIFQKLKASVSARMTSSQAKE